MPTYLYRHTLADARRWGEMDLYRESLQANIDCRHAIEEQIRENHDGLHMKTDVSALCREYGTPARLSGTHCGKPDSSRA